MNSPFTKFKNEFGKACTVSSVGILVAVFVSSKLTGAEISQEDFLFCVGSGILVLILGIICLYDPPQKPLPGH